MFTIQQITPTDNLSPIANEFDMLILPNGKKISKTDFCEHSLFTNTKEKETVFLQLQMYLSTSDFAKDYQTFLTDINTDFWFNRYATSPHQLAYLALIAFFSEAIDQEELFITNIVAYGYYEKLFTTNLVHVNVGILNCHNIATFLANSNYPLFAKEGFSNILLNLKSPEELKHEQTKLIDDLPLLSPLKRTYIEYTQTPFEKCECNLLRNEYSSLEQVLYFERNWKIGIKNVTNNQGTVVLLSPDLSIRLAKSATNSICREANDHHYMFGFSDNDTSLYNGIRIISIPSPLFYLPYPDECNKGSPGFQMYHHDILYHVVTDMNNPHIDIYCRLGTIIRSLATSEKNADMKHFFCEFAFNLVDREVLQYIHMTPERAFLTFLNQEFSSMIELYRAQFFYGCNRDSKIFEFPILNSFSNWLWNNLTEEEKIRLKITSEESINESLQNGIITSDKELN
ncbi:hypothetical protein BN1013_02122 [Candidatus Rubidus massiliensis]|nr:hypothetical protein BN1013_02122 [Candidatus Rubidus massiliensis]